MALLPTQANAYFVNQIETSTELPETVPFLNGSEFFFGSHGHPISEEISIVEEVTNVNDLRVLTLQIKTRSLGNTRIHFGQK